LEIAAREALDAELRAQVAGRAAAEVELSTAEVEIEQLQQGELIPTEEALAATRLARAGALEPIRTAHLAGGSSLPEDQRAAQVGNLEEAIQTADDLVDRRASEANRIASLLEVEKRRDRARAVLRSSQRAEARLQGLMSSRVEEYSGAFPEACAFKPAISALLAFAEARAEILARADEADAARLEAERGERELAPALDRLALAEGTAKLQPRVGQPLVQRVQALTQAITVHEHAFAELQRDKRDLIAQEAALSKAQRDHAGLAEAHQIWTAQWAGAARAIGLSDEADPKSAADLASLWIGARGELRSLAQTRRRLERMDEDEAELSKLITLTASALGLTPPQDCLAAGKFLAQRWRENDKVRVSREGLAPELVTLEGALRVQQALLIEVDAAAASLAVEAGLGAFDATTLTELAHRRRGLSQLQSERTQLIANVRSAGDGLEVTELRQAVGEQDLDTVRAELTSLEERLTALDEEIEIAIRAEQQARAALEAHEAPSVVTRAIVDRESATAEMHAAVERYVELRLTRELVAKAIQRVRTEQQDPLVKEAGAMFARMTRGEFKGVATDVDNKGQPVVVGVRETRNEAVGTMSDGTRDQLFLAFRLASLANYCKATEPLPFIADDILVHFDDLRGAATLELLADFCTTTQVLLFTHHLGVRAAAEKLVESGRANIVDLGQRL
jgi:hypothetical protein